MIAAVTTQTMTVSFRHQRLCVFILGKKCGGHASPGKHSIASRMEIRDSDSQNKIRWSWAEFGQCRAGRDRRSHLEEPGRGAAAARIPIWAQSPHPTTETAAK
jgi:hypothetical protein